MCRCLTFPASCAAHSRTPATGVPWGGPCATHPTSESSTCVPSLRMALLPSSRGLAMDVLRCAQHPSGCAQPATAVACFFRLRLIGNGCMMTLDAVHATCIEPLILRSGVRAGTSRSAAPAARLPRPSRWRLPQLETSAILAQLRTCLRSTPGLRTRPCQSSAGLGTSPTGDLSAP